MSRDVLNQLFNGVSSNPFQSISSGRSGTDIRIVLGPQGAIPDNLSNMAWGAHHDLGSLFFATHPVLTKIRMVNVGVALNTEARKRQHSLFLNP